MGKILSDLTSRSVLERLDLWDLEADEEGRAQQAADAELFFKIVTRAASVRGWTQCVWSELPPQNWSALLSQTPATATSALNRMRAEQEAVDLAFRYAESDAHPAKQAWVRKRNLACGMTICRLVRR